MSSVVYKFRCAQCASEYVGMTTRTHGTIGLMNTQGSAIEQEPVTYRHLILQYVIIQISVVPHLIPVYNSKILTNASCTYDLRILLSLFISKAKPVLNNQLSSYSLSIVDLFSCFMFNYFDFIHSIYILFPDIVSILELMMGFNTKRSY